MSFDGLAGFAKGVFNSGYEGLETAEEAKRRNDTKNLCNKVGLFARVGVIVAAALTALALLFGGAVSITLSLLLLVPFAVLMSDTNKVCARVEALLNDHWARVTLSGTKEEVWQQLCHDTIILKSIPVR
ncbi:hypothetical protein [Estrella lausannensis]|uniref:Putative membrane protein n=1 Tax=Estrella lausannensis TaxID=483423 RepID=A0A0H5DS86_9BACT|nr:hypothetical protein [Estrella lausannensis]CRX38594.1 putative membrane protein [Estrella lausannensis]